MSTSYRVRLGCSIVAAFALPLVALAQAPAKPAETKPAETKPANTKPAESKPAESKPADSKPADAAALPPAKEIVDNYIKATGGREAVEKIKNRIVKGKLDVPGAGMKGTMEMIARQPGFARMTANIEGIGKIDRGTDGKVAWEVGPAGPRMLDGDEFQDFVRAADLTAELNTEKYYKIQTKGIEKVGDSDAYKVEMIDLKNDKKIVHQYYDVKSGLLVRRSETMSTQMGDVPSDTFFENYKKFGDLLAPVITRQKFAGMEQIITMDSVDYPAEIADDKFAPPADVKALMDKPKSTDKKGEEPAKTSPPKP